MHRGAYDFIEAENDRIVVSPEEGAPIYHCRANIKITTCGAMPESNDRANYPRIVPDNL